MDAQTKGKLTREQVIKAANKMYDASPEMAMKIKNYVESLEQIVREQESQLETVKEMFEEEESLAISAIDERNKAREELAKYERIANIAKSYANAMRDDYSDVVDRATKRLALYLAIDALEAK